MDEATEYEGGRTAEYYYPAMFSWLRAIVPLVAAGTMTDRQIIADLAALDTQPGIDGYGLAEALRVVAMDESLRERLTKLLRVEMDAFYTLHWLRGIAGRLAGLTGERIIADLHQQIARGAVVTRDIQAALMHLACYPGGAARAYVTLRDVLAREGLKEGWWRTAVPA
jgi:hypothetical protein